MFACRHMVAENLQNKSLSPPLLLLAMQGRSITMKIKRRKEGAPEPSKFLGHGICDSLSRSLTLSRFIDSQVR